MKILIVGGTIFLGRRLVEAALARRHTVTTFRRGRHNDGAHPGVEALRGDRNADVSALRGRQWDVVIDTCGYVPGAVKRVMDALDRHIGHYTFVSSVSAYAEFPAAGSGERAAVATMTAEQVQEAEAIATGARASARTYGEMYGALKARCERAAEESMPGKVLNVRPGLDARDLSEWIVRAAEARTTGVLNATGAEDGLTFGRMLDACKAISGSDVRFSWLDESYLLDKGVQPWSELPLWIPDADNGIFEVRNDRAIAAGLTFRPLSDTVRDTLQWDRTRPQSEPLNAGLSHDREQQLLNDAPHSSH